MTGYSVTILGCGSSGGVPRLGPNPGGEWGACDPANPKNRRRRCSALIERRGPEGVTRVLIDTSPDMREQLVAAGVGTVDAVVYTHGHADHMHGIDDIRMMVFQTGKRVPVWADQPTTDRLMTGFGYIFVSPEGSDYPPIADLHLIRGDVVIAGAGGEICLKPLEVQHGNIRALGFRVGGMVYMPDVSAIDEEIWPELANLDVFIIDALRYRPHSSHSHLEQTLGWIRKLHPSLGVITNMHVDLDYDILAQELPVGVIPAYDGMRIDF